MSWRGRVRYPPIRTVNSPNMITPPCAVMSNIRAAGKPQTKTVKDPNAITSGGPTHVNMSETRACGSPPVSTVIAQGGRMGPPTCGTSTVSIGQTCMSVARAAGNMLSSISRLGLQRKPAVFWKRTTTCPQYTRCPARRPQSPPIRGAYGGHGVGARSRRRGKCFRHGFDRREFPTTAGAAIPSSTTATDFVARVSADGSKFLYSTYLPATAATSSVPHTSLPDGSTFTIPASERVPAHRR
jgi:hypothetical protein